MKMLPDVKFKEQVNSFCFQQVGFSILKRNNNNKKRTSFASHSIKKVEPFLTWFCNDLVSQDRALNNGLCANYFNSQQAFLKVSLNPKGMACFEPKRHVFQNKVIKQLLPVALRSERTCLNAGTSPLFVCYIATYFLFLCHGDIPPALASLLR